jgi:hypothetical protein
MANPKIIPKKSTQSLKAPIASDLDFGEIAINHADKKLYARHPSTGVVQEISPNTGGVSGSNTKTLAVFTPRNNYPPATAFATLDTRNSIAVLDFDAATIESAIFPAIIPEAADLASGLSVRITWMATTATTGNVRWRVSLERGNTDLDADSFDTASEANGTANGTSGIPTTTSIPLSTIDSVAVGEPYRLRISRVGNDAANDTMTGDAELIAVEVQQVA